MKRLRCDIISSCSGKLYGKAGDDVTIITNDEQVAIVEDKEGNRFPCRSENLVTDESQIDFTTKQIHNHGPVRKPRSSKPGPINQTLF